MAVNITQYLTIDNSYLGVGILMSVLSFIGSSCIIATFMAFKSLRTTSRKLLVYISAANIGVCVGHVIGAAAVIAYSDNFLSYQAFPACMVSSAITIFSRLSSYLWTCALSIYLTIAMYWKKLSFAKKLMGPFHLICWFFPAGVMVAAVWSDVIGFDTGPEFAKQMRPPWCWIDRAADDYRTWAFLAGGGWQIGAIFLCVVAYIFIQWSYLPKKNSSSESSAQSTDEVTLFVQTTNSKLKHIPLIFITLQIWSTWSFLATMYKKSPDWLVIMQEIGDQGQGLANAILFCLYTANVRKKICSKCKRCCCLSCELCGKCNCMKNKNIKLPVEMEALRSKGPEGEELMKNTNETEMEWDETGMS